MSEPPAIAPELAPLAGRLAPYARRLLARAGAYARFLHADEIGPEHLLCALMEDEDCAAFRAAAHAFADPETISEEARSLAAGIMVTGSAASLPFSELGVRALAGARELAAERGERDVTAGHLLLAAFEALGAELSGALEEAGCSRSRMEDALGEAAGVRDEETAKGSLFRHFDEPSKRALSQAARGARQAAAPSIGPAHILLACLGSDPALERAAGLSAARARLVLRGRTEDATPPSQGPLSADDGLVGFLGNLPRGADSLEILAAFHRGGTPELAQLLARHKVTPALLERLRPAFADPGDGGPAGS